jgi:hypothetical protein
MVEDLRWMIKVPGQMTTDHKKPKEYNGTSDVASIIDKSILNPQIFYPLHLFV